MTDERHTAATDPRTKAAVYVVEATFDEQHGLWREYSEEAKSGGWGSPGVPRVPWHGHSLGHGVQVGELAGFPVAISILYATVNGGLVLFWEATSRVVDYEMCTAWLRENVPAYSERHTNVANFGHCLGYLRSISGK